MCFMDCNLCEGVCAVLKVSKIKLPYKLGLAQELAVLLMLAPAVISQQLSR